MYYVRSSETGTIIAKVYSKEEGLALIERYETDDWERGCYSTDFYELVDENEIEE